MKCEYQSVCGFYSFLKEQGLRQEDGSCGKQNPTECSRNSVAQGAISIEKAQKIFQVPDIMTHPLPIAYEEVSLAYSQKKRRTPGPLVPGEIGPVAGDIIVPKGALVYTGGTAPQRTKVNIKLEPPLDKGEVGTAYNGYDYNN